MSDTTIDLELTPEDLAELSGADPHEVQKPMPAAAPFTAGRRERLKVMKAADTPPSNPALAQLQTAIQGLLQMESELRQLAEDLVGPIELGDSEVPTPPNDQPLIPRLRSDAEMLARLAIRQHKLIQEVRQRL